MALNHIVNGSVNYTVVGSPTITNGVASGFSSSDYLQTNSNLPSNSNMEFNIKFTAGVSGGTQAILGSPANNIYFGVKLMSYNQLDIILSYVGGNTDNVLNTKISQNTTYSLNCKLTNNKLLASLKNASGEELEYKEFDFSHELRQTAISFGYSGTSTYFTGSIDLNETYIKVNGEAWFGKCPVEVKHVNYGTPVGYTVVGSPTIVDGVASGFSTDNKIYTSDNFFPDSSTWEIVTKFTVTDLTNSTALFQRSDGYLQVSVRNSGKLRYYATGSNGSAISGFYASDGSNTLSVGNTYYLKVAFNGTTYAGYISQDGTTWTLDKTASSTVPLSTSYHRPIYFGFNAVNNGEAFPGSIDLNETYIKINGKTWFYRPCTNYVKKDNKLVFADSGLYIEENGVKTYATAYLAPVPSGYTIGETTTSSIGWVDMRTQTFTAAPEGATLGKDE